MAKISISFDTVSKAMEATLDGKTVDNVWGVEICPASYDGEGDDYCISLVTRHKDEESGMSTTTRIYAGESRRPSDATASAHAGFFQAQEGKHHKLHSDIRSFFEV